MPQRSAIELARRGHDVHVFAGWIDEERLDGETWDEVDEHGIRIRWTAITGWTDWSHPFNFENPRITVELTAYLQAVQPDLVHAHSLQGFGGGLITAAKALGIPTVVTMHDLWWFCGRQFLVDTETAAVRARAAGGLLPVRARRAVAAAPRRGDVRPPRAGRPGAGPVRRAGRPPRGQRRRPHPHPRRRERRAGGRGPRLRAPRGAGRRRARALRVRRRIAPDEGRPGPAGGRRAAQGPTAAGRSTSTGSTSTPTTRSRASASASRCGTGPRSRRRRPSRCCRPMTCSCCRRWPASPTRSLCPRGAGRRAAGDHLGHAGADGGRAPPRERPGGARPATPRRWPGRCGCSSRTAALLRAAATRARRRAAVRRGRPGRPPRVDLRRAAWRATSAARPQRGAVDPLRPVHLRASTARPLRYRARLPAEALALRGVHSEVRYYRSRRPARARRAGRRGGLLPRARHRAGARARRGDPRPSGSRCRSSTTSTTSCSTRASPPRSTRSSRHLPQIDRDRYWQGVHRYRTMLEHCDAYIGSTDALCAAGGGDRRASPPTASRTASASSWVGRRTARCGATRRPGPLRIGYFSGTSTHNADWAAVEPAVLEVLRRHPDVELWLGGLLEPGPGVEGAREAAASACR